MISFTVHFRQTVRFHLQCPVQVIRFGWGDVLRDLAKPADGPMVARMIEVARGIDPGASAQSREENPYLDDLRNICERFPGRQ